MVAAMLISNSCEKAPGTHFPFRRGLSTRVDAKGVPEFLHWKRWAFLQSAAAVINLKADDA
jgi:hypothetical protein